MTRKIRFGLIGCGRISYKHVEAIADFAEEAELVSVCDEIEENALKKAWEYAEYLRMKGCDTTGLEKPAVYTNLDEMLEKERLDIVSICTPSGLHPVHGIKAAQKGINVITEKPIATDLKLADELIKACDDANVKLFVVMQNRLNSTMQLLKKAVDKGRFGKIYMILVNVLWSRPQSYYSKADWRGTWELDGGAFMNQASHYVDALEWLGGPVDYVTAVTGTLGRKIEAEDTGSAVVKFKNGAIGNINVTMLTYPDNYEGSITVIGEKGTVRVGGVALNRIEKWDFMDNDEDDKLVDKVSYDPPNVYGFGHKDYYRNVLDVLKHGAEPITDGREGRKSLELILAIYKSSREGNAVRLPLE